MLVVDDRSANRELLGRLLRDMGFQIEEVADGKAAVDACARASYSLVWMDIRMPGLDGREALRQVRAADARQGRAPRKIVAITASVLELDQAGARAEGFDDLVNKPFRVEEIVAIVESLLGLTLVHPTQSSEAAPGERAPVLLAPWRRDDAELSTLSVEQRSRLLSSLVAGDVDHAQRVIETVKPASLATRLAATVDSFQFDVLIDVLRAGGAHTHNQRTPPP
jgi:two-component system sensor histidine kinase BarA